MQCFARIIVPARAGKSNCVMTSEAGCERNWARDGDARSAGPGLQLGVPQIEFQASLDLPEISL